MIILIKKSKDDNLILLTTMLFTKIISNSAISEVIYLLSQLRF